MRNTLPAVALAVAAMLGCQKAKPEMAQGALRGVTLPNPVPRPDFTLTSTDGKPFSFRERTAGKVALLFFGYTNCPDVCPVHTANVAAVLHTMSWEDRQRVMFVFVTTDPARDTLVALRKWLDHFDSSFVGLRGTVDQVNRAQQTLSLPPVIADPKAADGSYGVSHAAVVFAFEPDDSARVLYPFGIRQEDWANDLPILLKRSHK